MTLNNTKNNIALISTRPYEKNIILFKEIENKNILLLNYPLTEIKPLKYYTNTVWNNDEGEKGVKSYTTVGNQKNFNE